MAKILRKTQLWARALFLPREFKACLISSLQKEANSIEFCKSESFAQLAFAC